MRLLVAFNVVIAIPIYIAINIVATSNLCTNSYNNLFVYLVEDHVIQDVH